MADWLPPDLTLAEWQLFKDLVLACCEPGAGPSLLGRIPPDLREHRLAKLLEQFLVHGDHARLDEAGRALTGNSARWREWLATS